jgi:uncharacterized protein YcbK (DUF882 family)
MALQRRQARFGSGVLTVLGFLCSFALAGSARADRQHTVKSGQSLGQIAKQYGVSIAALAKTNKLDPEASLQVGQRLVLPGGKPTKAEKKWGVPARRGRVTFYRIWSRERMRVQMVDDRGVVRPGAQRSMRELMRPRESGKRKLPNTRLLRLLAQVSDYFGGRQLDIVSGYRLPGGFTNDTSRHVAGEAMDFRIAGVPLTELRDHCQKFDHVGVGYYPRSQFVHLDVRRQNARWTDWSLPGQAAILRKPDDIDDSGKSIEAEPILPANERNLESSPPAPDDGQPPIDDAPPDPRAEEKASKPAAAPKPTVAPKPAAAPKPTVAPKPAAAPKPAVAPTKPTAAASPAHAADTRLQEIRRAAEADAEMASRRPTDPRRRERQP